MSHPILGSKHVPRAQAQQRDRVDPNHPLELTLVVEGSKPETWSDDLHAFAEEHNLTLTPIDARHVKIAGSVKNLETAFSVNLHHYQLPNGTTYHAHDGEIHLPAHLSTYVIHVFGFDTAPVAHPYIKTQTAASKVSNGPFNPTQLSHIYNFPAGDGTGQKVGVIELGGGYVESDIQTYFHQLGITATPNLHAVGVDGGTNNPNDPSGASTEVVLDVEIIAALVPKATINVYFCPNTDQGFYDAIHRAITDGVSVISISWGGPESDWASSSLTAYNALFRSAPTVTTCVASGDNGSSDGVDDGRQHVDFPASSPYVLGCGGTQLSSTNNLTIAHEIVWNDGGGASGGGISQIFNKPSYQNSVAFLASKKRGVPDVCADADPNTGYIIYMQGQQQVVGGTSAVAPLWSGLVTRINQITTKRIGFINPILYAHATVCHDITQGNNGAYKASPGWDACTGLGSPNGQAILGLFNTAANKKKEITKESS
jgi:kumamolisin